MVKQVSRNWSVVPTGTHKGAGENKNKNLPDDSGYITFTSSLGFLYKQKENAAKKKKPNSYLLGVLSCGDGYDSVKKRLNFYGLFGKSSQNSPSKGFKHGKLTKLFLFGGKVTTFQSNRLNEFMAAIERSLGDENATAKNHRNSPKYEEALKRAEFTQIIVQAKFDSQYFSIDEEDESIGSLSLGYVVFATGKKPVVANLDPSDSDDLVDVIIDEKDVKADPIDKGAVSFSATRSYLKNYNGSEFANLRMIKKDDQSFWAVTLGSFETASLTEDFFKFFDQETIDKIKETDYVKFSGIIKSEMDIDRILNVDNYGDAILVVTGAISVDEDDNSLRFHASEPNSEGKTFKSAIFKVRQSTIYTQKLL